MFIITKKLRRGKLTLCCILLALVLGVVGAGAGLACAIQGAVSASTADGISPKGIRTNADRVAFLQAHGWLVNEEPAATEDVLIPETFDASYDDYLALQTAQGFDLLPYAGKTVKRYTYQVNNYPGLKENIWASLLVYKKTVIGGEVFCSQGDGFTQGLDYPIQTG
jgi:hypothetical protein